MPYDDKENYCCKLERIPMQLYIDERAAPRRAASRTVLARAFDAWPGIKMFLLGAAFPSFPNSTLQRPAVLRDSEGRSMLEMSAAFTRVLRSPFSYPLQRPVAATMA
jgi:hypothetical protein